MSQEIPEIAWGALPDLPSSQDTANSDSDYVPQSPRVTSTAANSQFDESVELSSARVNVDRVLLNLSTNQDVARALLDGLPSIKVGWCDLCTMRPTKAGGYIQVSWEGANKVVMLQEVVLWASGGWLGVGEQCSHLCGNPSCKTEGHVVAESELENQRRKGCCVWVDCPHCFLKINCCPHGGVGSDKCIKYCNDFENAAAFWQSGLHASGI